MTLMTWLFAVQFPVTLSLHGKYLLHLLHNSILIHYFHWKWTGHGHVKKGVSMALCAIHLKNHLIRHHFSSPFRPQTTAIQMDHFSQFAAKGQERHRSFFPPCYKVFRDVTGATVTLLLYSVSTWSPLPTVCLVKADGCPPGSGVNSRLLTNLRFFFLPSAASSLEGSLFFFSSGCRNHLRMPLEVI